VLLDWRSWHIQGFGKIDSHLEKQSLAGKSSFNCLAGKEERRIPRGAEFS
jgi:hypothetical protein